MYYMVYVVYVKFFRSEQYQEVFLGGTTWGTAVYHVVGAILSDF